MINNIFFPLIITPFFTCAVFINSVYSQIHDHDIISNSEMFFIDGHSHLGLTYDGDSVKVSDIEYLKQMNIEALFFALPVDRSETDNLLKRIESEIGQIELLKTTNTEFDISKLSKTPLVNELSIIYCIEYFHSILNNDVIRLDKFSNLGIKYISVISNSKDNLFIKNELTDFGKQVVERCNQLNLSIDITHLNESEMISVIQYSEKPVIASHSCIKSVTELSSNLTDKALKLIAKKGGLIFVSFSQKGLFASKENHYNGIQRFCKHIDYLTNLVGTEHIGIGTDLQAAGKYIPQDMNTENCLANIKSELIMLGYSYADIDLIMKDNIIRVL